MPQNELMATTKRNATMQAVVDKMNAYFKQSAPEHKECREHMASLLSTLLMDAGCYRGFNYLYWQETGCTDWNACGRPEGVEKDFFLYGPSGDRSRVRYN